MKYVVLFLFTLTIDSEAFSQIDDQKNAFGLRFGFNDRFEGEANYQRF